MNQSERIPPLNTLRFIPANDVLKPQYNTWSFDRGFFNQKIRKFYQLDVDYVQKISKGDLITIYFDSLATYGFTTIPLPYVPPMLLNIIDGDGNIISSNPPLLNGTAHTLESNFPNNTDPTYGQNYGTFIFVLDLSRIDLPDGHYYITAECLYEAPGDPANTWYVSECFHYRNGVFERTMLLEYHNTTNDFDIYFERLHFDEAIKLPFQSRFEMDITEVSPASAEIGFQNMSYQVEKLQSVPYRVFELTVGGEAGVPPWVLDKVNRILSCDIFYIDGTQYVKDINASWAPKKVEGYPMKAATIMLREADNSMGWVFVTPPLNPFEFRIHSDEFDDTHD